MSGGARNFVVRSLFFAWREREEALRDWWRWGAAYAWLNGTTTGGLIDGRMAAAPDSAFGDGAHDAVERMPNYTFAAASNVRRRNALATILAKTGSGPSSS